MIEIELNSKGFTALKKFAHPIRHENLDSLERRALTQITKVLDAGALGNYKAHIESFPSENAMGRLFKIRVFLNMFDLTEVDDDE